MKGTIVIHLVVHFTWKQGVALGLKDSTELNFIGWVAFSCGIIVESFCNCSKAHNYETIFLLSFCWHNSAGISVFVWLYLRIWKRSTALLPCQQGGNCFHINSTMSQWNDQTEHSFLNTFMYIRTFYTLNNFMRYYHHIVYKYI